MKSRRFYGHQEKPSRPLTDERKEEQKAKASCYLVIKFHDGNTWSKWSNEHGQPKKLLNINDAVNEMFRIAHQYFQGKIHSAAIFDTREHKKPGAYNKIYQYEKGFWTQVQQFTW